MLANREAYLIGIFNAQKELAAVLPAEQIVEQCSSEATQMKQTGWRWRKPRSYHDSSEHKFVYRYHIPQLG